MNRSLRKRHLNFWILLALALPLGFIWSYRVIPHNLPDPLVANKSSREAMFLAKRIRGANGTNQLEITIRRPLTTPSTLVYLASKAEPDIKNAILIGSLGPKGTYRFNLPTQIPLDPIVLFYDAVNESTFHQLAIP